MNFGTRRYGDLAAARDAERLARRAAGEAAAAAYDLAPRKPRGAAYDPNAWMPREWALVSRAPLSTPDHPFKIVKVGTDKVRIVYGSVNGVGATTGDEANDGTVTPAPTLTLANGLNNIYVEAVWDGADEPMAFQSCAVRVGETPAESDDSAAFGIGSVMVQNGAIVQINQGVIQSLSCFRYKCLNSSPVYQWGNI